MIALCYGLSGALLLLTGAAFAAGAIGAVALAVAWSVIFFFASAGASAAYLTAGECFPLEIRAVAISLFYAFGSLVGAGGPVLFGMLIGSGERSHVFWGYVLGGGLMIAGAAVELWLGVAAEGRPLEEVAPPLSQLRSDADPCRAGGEIRLAFPAFVFETAALARRATTTRSFCWMTIGYFVFRGSGNSSWRPLLQNCGCWSSCPLARPSPSRATNSSPTRGIRRLSPDRGARTSPLPVRHSQRRGA